MYSLGTSGRGANRGGRKIRPGGGYVVFGYVRQLLTRRISGHVSQGPAGAKVNDHAGKTRTRTTGCLGGQ